MTTAPDWFSEDHDVLTLLNVMRSQMRERYGANLDQPWPAREAVAHSTK